jgi:hypothetical protein
MRELLAAIGLAVALTLAFGHPAHAAIALVQYGHAGAGSSGGTSQAATLNGTTVGDLIVVGVRWCGSATCGSTDSAGVSSVTDSVGDTCAHAPNTAGVSLYTPAYLDIWYCGNIGGGNDTITVNFSGTVYYQTVYLSEYSGAVTSSPFVDGATDLSYNFNPGSNPAYSVNNFYVPTAASTSQSGDLLYSLIYPASGTITAGNSALSGPDEYQVASAPGPYMNTWSLSASPSAVVMSIAAFRAASGIAGSSVNTVNFGAYSDPQPGGSPSGFEAAMEAFESWLGWPIYSGYSVAYGPYAFDCSGGGTACMTNTYNFTSWFNTASRMKQVWSVALTGCDHAVNLSGTTQCTPGHTIPLTSTNSIASGYEDSVFDMVFSTIRSIDPNAIVRLGWEMNLPNWTWGVGGSGGDDMTGAAYVAAFQHVAAIAHSYGLKVDWCPSTGAASGPADAFFPGDGYVDYIGQDFYDLVSKGSPAASWANYETEPYGLFWHAAFASLHGKPLAYDEWGCGNGEGDTQCAYIIDQMSTWFKNENVAYFNFFNTNNGAGSYSGQICDNGTAGRCGAPYQYPLSAADFLSRFGWRGNPNVGVRQASLPTYATYYMSPSGSDSNTGTSTSPWASPNHSRLNCGDVIVAASGTYSFSNLTITQTVTCAGGNNVVWVRCAIFDSCKVTSNGVLIRASYWGVEGWEVDGGNACFAASPLTTSASIGYIVFADDIANGCQQSGIVTYNNGSAGVDNTIVIGNVVYNASQTTGNCDSGISIGDPRNDASSNHFIYVAWNLSYDNHTTSCLSTATATNAATASGSSTLHFSVSESAQVGKYVRDITTPNAIPSGTHVTASGTNTLTMSANAVGSGVGSGDTLSFDQNSDETGLAFDTWCDYAGAGVAENNLLIGNGGPGFEATGCANSNAPIVVRNNTAGLNDTMNELGAGLAELSIGAGGVGWHSSQVYANVAYGTAAKNNYNAPAALFAGLNDPGPSWPSVIDDNFVYQPTTGYHWGVWNGSSLRISCQSPHTTPATGSPWSGETTNPPGGCAGMVTGTSPAFVNPTIPGAPNCSGSATTLACMATAIANWTTTNPTAAHWGAQTAAPTDRYNTTTFECNVYHALPSGLAPSRC